MGRLTELFSYLNVEEHPTAQQIIQNYNYITINKTVKELRKIYRKELKQKEQMRLFENI